MNAVVSNHSLKTGTRKYYGQVLMNGFDKISIACIDKNGSKKIKTFDKSKWSIKLYE